MSVLYFCIFFYGIFFGIGIGDQKANGNIIASIFLGLVSFIILFLVLWADGLL